MKENRSSEKGDRSQESAVKGQKRRSDFLLSSLKLNQRHFCERLFHSDLRLLTPDSCLPSSFILYPSSFILQLWLFTKNAMFHHLQRQGCCSNQLSRSYCLLRKLRKKA